MKLGMTMKPMRRMTEECAKGKKENEGIVVAVQTTVLVAEAVVAQMAEAVAVAGS
jgi:hypothetical protein